MQIEGQFYNSDYFIKLINIERSCVMKDVSKAEHLSE
jgi:hypothetical protein